MRGKFATKHFNTLNLNQSKFYLHCLSEARPQEREEDTGDGDMVPWLGETRVFPAGIHRHASGDVTHWYLIALSGRNIRGDLKKKKIS